MTNNSSSSQTTAKPTKQAVVLVHGMGEQVPMETLRGFVETMWVRNPDIHARRDGDPVDQGNPVWWKPDFRTGSLELSRITTREAGQDHIRTDFFEFYWADLTDANTMIQLKDWFMSLLLRWPYQVPPDVVWVWLLLWGTTIVFGGLALWRGLAAIFSAWHLPTWASATLGVGTALYAAMIGFVLAYFGDVARYVRAKPPNIAARREIRSRGLTLLRTLSESKDYHRIVLVAHSLGTIVAYDVLRSFWAEREDARKMEKGDALYQAFERLEQAAKTLPDHPSGEDLDAYRKLQSAIFDAMQDGRAENWLISDFITLGSPLAHAQFLIARDDDALRDAIEERRYPTSPPEYDAGHFVYAPQGGSPIRSAHHAAPFATVRWTNIFDPAGEIVFLRGDLIGGPVQPNFGRAIVEVPVEIRRKNAWLLSRLFTHTEYWSATGGDDPQLRVLRLALDLLRPVKPPQVRTPPQGEAGASIPPARSGESS